MTPARLTAEHFAGYPPVARQIATRGLEVLRRLPLSFVPLLLREVIAYDWKFPAERQEVDAQFIYMSSLSREQLADVMSAFARLMLSPEMEAVDWVRSPGEFSERLSAHLWTSGQLASFRSAAVDFLAAVRAAIPPPGPAIPRLGLVVVGQGVTENRYPLFRKLRSHGTYFTQVDPQGGLKIMMQRVAARAEKYRSSFAHWYVDGGVPLSPAVPGVEMVAYRQLNPVRDLVVDKIRSMIRSGIGTEALRSGVMQLRPQDVGLNGDDGDTVLNHFKVSVLSEGSGTQFFSTTFVQWAAREVWRRAQPVTLFARFAPRITERSMNEALMGISNAPVLDPQGALVDADMGAFYTWSNQMRLPGANESRFIAWFENHSEAIVISPSIKPAMESETRVNLNTLLDEIEA
jgi:hypothetical protein